MHLTYAFCSYNRADRLPALVAAMRAQSCPIPFDILAVNNNSRDDTLAVLSRLTTEPGPGLRVVTEMEQGIVPARNRAIQESLASDILVFVDDDEIPEPGVLAAACHAILEEGADCAGGRVRVDFTPHVRPGWLGDELLGFLAEVDHGDQPFWIRDADTPIWTANVAYATRLFRDDAQLRFDQRYNRVGADVGGGEDAIMFRSLLARGAKLRYRPDMVVRHFVEPWRLERGYFLRLHYRAGLRHGRHQLPEYPSKVLGIPPFLVLQFAKQCARTVRMSLLRERQALRQAMNASHALGTMIGYAKRGRND
jgi:succinoglycan biosynthesis protein ExoM